MSRAKVMAPAIALARDGFVLTRAPTPTFCARLRAALQQGDPEAAKIFLHPDGSPLQPGDRLVQSDLAATLQAIADQGPDAFYRGAIAQKQSTRRCAPTAESSPPPISPPTASARPPPLACDYRGYRFVSAPPPSSGGVTMCEILNILEGYRPEGLGFHSAASVHLMVEAMRHAFVDRNSYLGDPAFVSNPLDTPVDAQDYAARIRAAIHPRQGDAVAARFKPGVAPHEKRETTHFSVIDTRRQRGRRHLYDQRRLRRRRHRAAGTGFFLNDEMDDFTVKPGVANLFGLVQGEANAIAPGKRPLSSMAPTAGRPRTASVVVRSAARAARASSPRCWRRRST